MKHQVILPWMPYTCKCLYQPLFFSNEPPVDRLLLLSPATLLIVAITSSLLWWRSSGGGPLYPNPIDYVSLDWRQILGASQLWCLLPHWLRRRIIIVHCFPSRSLCNYYFFAVAALIQKLIVFSYFTDFPASSIVATTYSFLCRHCSGLYCYVPSLPILLSSPVTGSGLRLRYSCGALAHQLFL